ncbi:VWA domain-containing protein [Gandjariella thermophila]|uniref:VWA domain-containing protein n=1 Tax=Gandjariella thermophila TaxID=1931992 RepID=A0A4D4JE79_9PSEU|nr:VWA domain-containing protein [Gandjariella thermophila]GDY32659.1 VWA domain-containing protein [Gandjariella thermophila]
MSDRAETGFTITVSENKYLAEQDTEVVAVLTVSATGLGRLSTVDGAGSDTAEVILLDCSGSMSDPPTKLAAAKRATCAAIDALRDGVRFAVVRGTHEAALAYPQRPGLAVADRRTRTEAKDAVNRLVASGGTAMGRWLALGGELLADHPSAVRHATLITDGRQEHETRAELDAVLADCTGRFVCDARGIGDHWEPTELLHIAAVLNGQARGVARFDEMVADFRDLTVAAMRRSVPDVDLRVRTVATARLHEIQQVHPTFADLTPRVVRRDDRTVEIATGSWADETREYQVRIAVDPAGQPKDEDLLAARVDVLVRGAGFDARPIPPALILVHWTDDPGLFTRLDEKVTHYAGQEELGDAVRAGCDAYNSGDAATAVEQLGRAVMLADRSGNEDILRNLRRLVEVVDAAAGLVRLRTDVPLSEILATYTGSVSTSRGGRARRLDAEGTAATVSRTCPECSFVSRGAAPAGPLVCERCSHQFPARQEDAH